MTVIVQQPINSDGNPQPMVYDSDTKKIIVDHDGYVLMGMDRRLVNVPTKANFISTPKTQTSGLQEAHNYLANTGGGIIKLTAGIFLLDVPVVYYSPYSLRMTGVLSNEDTSSSYTISSKLGTTIAISSKYTAFGTYMFNYAGSTSADNNDGYVELDHFLIRGVSSLIGLPSDITSLTIANAMEFGVYVGPDGLGAGVIINTPVRKYIHDIKFNLCRAGIKSYDSGGPSIYERLHYTYMGYTNGTAILNASDMYIVDVDATLRDVEFFTSFNAYQIEQRYVSSNIPSGTMSIVGAYFGNCRGGANIRTGYYCKISNVYQTNSASLSPGPAQLISIEGHSTYVSVTEAIVQSAALFTSYNTPSTSTSIIADNIFLDNSTGFSPQLTIQEGRSTLVSGSIMKVGKILGSLVFGNLPNIIFSPSPQTTILGTTSGSFVASMPEQTNTYKKVLIYLDDYENDSTTAQTYTYPVAFSTVAVITANNAGVPWLSTSLTEFSIAPNTGAIYSGIIIIEGY
ncbi:MAG: hypothetical protein ACYDC6_14225 [Acidobacteriaceae bacterium]